VDSKSKRLTKEKLERFKKITWKIYLYRTIHDAWFSIDRAYKLDYTCGHVIALSLLYVISRNEEQQKVKE